MRAANGPIAVGDVRHSLCEADPAWAQPERIDAQLPPG